MTTDSNRLAAGERNRRRVLGDAHVDRSLGNRTAFNAEWVDFITRTAWGDIWERPGLDNRARSIVELSVATALGRWEEFRLHVRTGLATGDVSKDELKEIILQATVYCGARAGNHAMQQVTSRP